MQTNMKITVLNARYDKKNRTEVYIPTVISKASYLESCSSNHSKGINTSQISYKLRIPFDALAQNDRTYVNEMVYKAMEDEEAVKHWTLRKNDYIILTYVPDWTEEMTLSEIETYSYVIGIPLIKITEYADNTTRGTSTVRHWRIGGE